MAKTGRAAQALATSAIGSFIAGTIGTMLIVLVMPQVVKFAISPRVTGVPRDHPGRLRRHRGDPGLVPRPRVRGPAHRA